MPAGDLSDWAGETARRYGGAATGVTELRTSSQAVVLTCGDVVVKVHRPGTGAHGLAARLAFCAAPAQAGVLLPPLEPAPLRVPDGLVAATEGTGALASVWPRVETVPPDPDTAPWDDAARLLAALHRLPVGGRGADVLPEHGAVVRLRRALDGLAAAAARRRPAVRRPAGMRRPAGIQLPAGASAAEEARDAAGVVRAAAAKLPDRAWTPSAPPRPRTVVHGDWHLGQLGGPVGGAGFGGGAGPGGPVGPGGGAGRGLVGRDGGPERAGRRTPGRWVLIDVDDLGLGDPAWDLARPAAFAAAGLLPDGDWLRFLDAYRDAGGPAVPVAPLDPWPALDPVARACVVQAAAAGVRRALAGDVALDDVDRVLVGTCAALAR